MITPGKAPLIRRLLQFESVSDVLARGSILVLFISISAGLSVYFALHGYFDADVNVFAAKAYLVGAIAGFVIGAPIVFAFFFAAKAIYGVNLEVAKIASEDFLTGLLNRRAFFGLMTGQEDMRGQPANCARSGYLMIGDADNFKRINDTLGHLFGDKALILIAESFRAANLENAVAARIGGEEFAVFVGHTDMAQTNDLAERIRRSIEMAELIHETGQVTLSISIGVTAVEEGDSLSHIMKRADDALYRAKQNGKNQVVFHGVSVVEREQSPKVSSEHRAA